jgi:hypothetical protein
VTEYVGRAPEPLQRRARQEADELGAEPTDVAERDRWREERWGAVVLLAGLADDDAELLRQSARDGVAEVWPGLLASSLLLDAAALAALADPPPPPTSG